MFLSSAVRAACEACLSDIARDRAKMVLDTDCEPIRDLQSLSIRGGLISDHRAEQEQHAQLVLSYLDDLASHGDPELAGKVSLSVAEYKPLKGFFR